MTGRSASPNGFPRMPLIGASLLLGFVLLAALVGRMNGGGVEPPTARVTAERILRFDDRSDGAVIVSLAGSGQVVDVMTGQNGFLRGTLRGFARSRRADGIGSQPPLQLTGYADGRLMLSDPSTGRRVELEAFGSANEAVFVRLLTMVPGARHQAAPAAQTANAAAGPG